MPKRKHGSESSRRKKQQPQGTKHIDGRLLCGAPGGCLAFAVDGSTRCVVHDVPAQAFFQPESDKSRVNWDKTWYVSPVERQDAYNRKGL